MHRGRRGLLTPKKRREGVVWNGGVSLVSRAASRGAGWKEPLSMPHKALRGDVPLPMRAYNARREQAHTPLVHADSRKAQGGDGRHTEGGRSSSGAQTAELLPPSGTAGGTRQGTREGESGGEGGGDFGFGFASGGFAYGEMGRASPPLAPPGGGARGSALSASSPGSSVSHPASTLRGSIGAGSRPATESPGPATPGGGRGTSIDESEGSRLEQVGTSIPRWQGEGELSTPLASRRGKGGSPPPPFSWATRRRRRMGGGILLLIVRLIRSHGLMQP